MAKGEESLLSVLERYARSKKRAQETERALNRQKLGKEVIIRIKNQDAEHAINEINAFSEFAAEATGNGCGYQIVSIVRTA